jgi:hypothetical protein
MSDIELETRVLLSARAAAVTTARHAHEHATATSTASRVPPATEITVQYKAFLNDFTTVEQYYINAINEQSSGPVTVTTTVAAAYTPPSASIQVTNASVFFPNGPIPVVASAIPAPGSPVIGTFTLIGFSGTTLFINVTASTPVNLPVGTVLTASVMPSSLASAAALFPSFITNRANQMAINLVKYFNSLPLKLPYFNTPPHTPNNRGAIQNYVYGAVAGGGTTSLLQSLLAIPLPTTAGSPLQIYNATVASAISQSLTQTLNGVSEIYAHQLRVAAPFPNNRYGATETGTVPSYITASP